MFITIIIITVVVKWPSYLKTSIENHFGFFLAEINIHTITLTLLPQCNLLIAVVTAVP
jgi:hypothetical protein